MANLSNIFGRKMTQEERILKALIRADYHGLTNYDLSRFALKYTSVVSDLRKDGHNIVCVREKLKNGRASNTYRYYLTKGDN